MVASAETVTMSMYSARKNSANLIERVLGVEAGDQLALGLGQVERGAVGLADHRDDVDDEDGQQRVTSRIPDTGPACASTISEVDIEPA